MKDISKMTNLDIAEALAGVCYYPQDNSVSYAMQLFVENVVLPYNVQGYTKQEMQEHIMKYLKVHR